VSPQAHSAFQILRPQGKGRFRFVIFCDHASNRIPAELHNLGLPASELDRHIAWGIGAAAVTGELSDIFDSPAILCGTSRLVIDCNRELDAHDLTPEVSDGTPVPGNRDLSAEAGSSGSLNGLRLTMRPWNLLSRTASHSDSFHRALYSLHDSISRWKRPVLAGRPVELSRPRLGGMNELLSAR
jgi:hypothetical protein